MSGGPAWDAGAFTSSGIAGNGLLSFTLDANSDYAIGLSATDLDANYTSIDFGLYVSSSDEVFAIESGAVVWASAAGFVSSSAGSVLATRRTGTAITYEKDGVVLFTSAKTSSGTLFGDCAVYASGTAIHSVGLYAGANLTYTTWTNLVAVSAT